MNKLISRILIMSAAFLMPLYQCAASEAQQVAAEEAFAIPSPKYDLSEVKQISYPGIKTVTLKSEYLAKPCPDLVGERLTVNYPQQTGHPAIDKKMRAYAEKKFQEHDRGLKKAFAKEDGWICDPHDLSTVGIIHEETLFFISKPSDRYLSVMFYTFRHRNYRPFWEYKTFVYDLSTGKELTWSDIFGSVDFAYTGETSEENWLFCPESFKQDYKDNYSKLYTQYGYRYGDLRVLAVGCPFVLTPEGLSSVCGPYTSCRVTNGLHNSSEVNMPKEELIKLGVPPKYWQQPLPGAK